MSDLYICSHSFCIWCSHSLPCITTSTQALASSAPSIARGKFYSCNTWPHLATLTLAHLTAPSLRLSATAKNTSVFKDLICPLRDLAMKEKAPRMVRVFWLSFLKSECSNTEWFSTYSDSTWPDLTNAMRSAWPLQPALQLQSHFHVAIRGQENNLQDTL